jgi:drug/metabolite transporter (DMT)-like permease
VSGTSSPGGSGATLPPDGATTVAFALLVVLGGGNFLAVRVSNTELEPFWGAGLRFGVAALVFVAIALALRLPWPRGRQLGVTALYGMLGFALFYALMYWSLVRVTAGVATVVLASVPLVTLLLATAQGLERFRVRSGLGALMALAGIAWMVVGPQQVVVPLAALFAMLLAAVCVSQSVIVGKRLSANHPAVTNAVAMSVGAILLLGWSALLGEPWVLPRERGVVWAVTYLVTLGSVGLFVLFLLVVRRWTASATAYMFVLFPVATIGLEALLLGEPVTLQAAVGAALVMAGVWFGALWTGPQPEPVVASVPVPPALEPRSGRHVR